MNEKTPEPQPEISPEEAIERINQRLLQEMSTGSLDGEPAQMASITEAVRKGDITPEEGMQKAQTVFDSRQDYH
ncbi:MAG: hypothetical protein WDZ82_01680 [Candidatus Paceibacterota bacterium]